jgi:hypothetical protein
MLRSLDSWLVTGVSGQPIGCIFKIHAVQEQSFLDSLTLEDRAVCPETSLNNYQSTLRNIP